MPHPTPSPYLPVSEATFLTSLCILPESLRINKYYVYNLEKYSVSPTICIVPLCTYFP